MSLEKKEKDTERNNNCKLFKKMKRQKKKEIHRKTKRKYKQLKNETPEKRET